MSNLERQSYMIMVLSDMCVGQNNDVTPGVFCQPEILAPSLEIFKGSGHYWQLLKIITSIKPSRVTSYGERLIV